MRIAAVLILFVSLARIAAADEIAPPKGPFPQPVRALLREGAMFVQQAVWVPEIRTQTQQGDDGEPRSLQVMELRPQFIVRSFKAGEYRVFTADGDRLSEKETAEAFAKETSALLNGQPKLIDERYTALLRPETLIIYVREQGPGAVLGGPPAGNAAPPKFSTQSLPKSPPPAVAIVGLEEETVTLHAFGWQALPEYRLEEREVKSPQGNVQKYSVRAVTMHMLPVPLPKEFSLDEVNVTGLDGKGKKVADVREDLQSPQMALVHAPEQELNEQQLKHFRDEVLVVEVPQVPQYAPTYPNFLPPHHAWARVGEGKIHLRYAAWQAVPTPVIVKQTSGGKEEERWQTRVDFVPKYYKQTHKVAEIEATDAAGEPIDAEKLTELFKDDELVLLSGDTSPVGPLYLQHVKPSSVTIAAPSLQVNDEPPTTALPNPAKEQPSDDATAADKEGLKKPSPSTVFVRLHGDLLVVRHPKMIKAQFSAPPGTSDGESAQAAEYRTTIMWDDQVVPLDKVRITDLAGEEIAAEEISKRLGEETAVLLNETDKPFAEAYLTLYEPETLILHREPIPSAFAIPSTAPVPAAPSQ